MQEVVAMSRAPADGSVSRRRAKAIGTRRWRARIGWAAVCLSTAMGSIYGWWGIVQNFTMGWYEATTTANVLLMLAYLSPLLAVIVLTSCAIRFPDTAFATHSVIAAALCAWLFYQYWIEGRGLLVDHRIITAGTLVVIGLLYSFGRPEPASRAYVTILLIPVAVTVATGIGPAARAYARTDDGDRSARVVEGSGLTLVWAPEGPGWSRTPVTWHEAVRISAHLSDDGRSIVENDVNAWRLPTVDELVRSLTSGQRHAGGEWNSELATARYLTRPAKESPLWRVRSPIIYWWTATQLDDRYAYAVCFNGRVVLSPQNSRFRGRGFRAVRVVASK